MWGVLFSSLSTHIHRRDIDYLSAIYLYTLQQQQHTHTKKISDDGLCNIFI